MNRQYCNAFENPFFILKASLNDGVDKLNELYEDSLFESEENEAFLKEARDILTNNLLRLNAEIHWFGDLDFKEIDHFLSPGSWATLPSHLSKLGILNFIVHHAKEIKKIDFFDKWLSTWHSLSKEKIFQSIQQSRTRHQFYSVDQEQVNKALEHLMNVQVNYLNEKQKDNPVLQQWLKLKQSAGLVNIRSDSPLYLIVKEQITQNSTGLNKERDLITEKIGLAYKKIEQKLLTDHDLEPVVFEIINDLDHYFEMKVTEFNNTSTMDKFNDFIYYDLFIFFQDDFVQMKELSGQDVFFTRLKFSAILIDHLKNTARQVFDKKLSTKGSAEFKENHYIHELDLTIKKHYMTETLKVNYPEIYTEIVSYPNLEALSNHESIWINFTEEIMIEKIFYIIFPSIISVLEKDEDIRLCIYHQLLQFAVAQADDSFLQSTNRIQLLVSVLCLSREYPTNKQIIDIEFNEYVEEYEKEIFSMYFFDKNETAYYRLAYKLQELMPEYMNQSTIFNLVRVAPIETSGDMTFVYIFWSFIYIIVMFCLVWIFK